MRLRFNTFAWLFVLATAFLFASPSPAHAQINTCKTVCTSNTNCGNGCEVEVGGVVEDTTCGGNGSPCCTPTTTTTLFCTAQCLNTNSVCVQAEVSTVTTTCGSNSTSTMETSKQKSPDPSGTNCPTEITPGCEGVISCG